MEIFPQLTVEQHRKVVEVLMKYVDIFTVKTEDTIVANIPPVEIQDERQHYTYQFYQV